MPPPTQWDPFNNASFGTFCIQIGQLLEPHWVFEDFMEIDISVLLKQNQRDHWIFSDLHRLTVFGILDFGQIWMQKVQKEA